MDVSAKTDAFVAKYNGQYIDEDKWYGSQCWDVVARYAREVWACPHFPTGSGGAEGLWRFFSQPIPQYFDKVPASDLKKGDIVVWSSEFYVPWGHTALVWERDGNTIFVLEQDGSKDTNSDGNADGVSYIAQRTITSKISGGLRPKGGTMDASNAPADAKFVTLVVSLGEYREATAADIAQHKNQPGSALLQTFINSKVHANQQFKIADYDRLKKEFEEYKKANPIGGTQFVPAGELFVKKEGK